MLKNISWQNFTMLIVLLWIIWYCYVGIVYYAKDIKKIIKFKGNRMYAKETTNKTAANENEHDGFTQAQTLRNNIAGILKSASQNKFPKEELVMALQLSVREYPELKQSAFEVAINHYISHESEKQCSTSFSDEDLRMIWMG